MNEQIHSKSENRKALPKFAMTMVGSLLVGGFVGFLVGMTHVLGLDPAALTEKIGAALEAMLPWAIPVSSVLILGATFLLYRSAAKKYAAWNGGDEDAISESVEEALSWSMLLSAVQLLINFFFMAALAAKGLGIGSLWIVGEFMVSCGLVIFAQQKAVDLERKMNPEKHGSVYDSKFQKKWLESCDESERRQIGEASYRAYMVTTRLCLGLWLLLVVLSMVVEMSLLPVFILLVVWGTMQVTYALESIRLGKHSKSV